MENPFSNFLMTLAAMLNKYHSSITFRRDNDTIVVSDLRAFINHILPKYFRHRNYKLFTHQLNSHGLTIYDSAFRQCSSRNGTQLKCSQGIDKLKSCMKYARQVSLIQRIGSKFQAALVNFPDALNTASTEQLVEKLFQIKKLNRDYGQCLEACSKRIEAKLSQIDKDKAGEVPKPEGSLCIIQQGSEEFIDLPLEMRTERVIRFAS